MQSSEKLFWALSVKKLLRVAELSRSPAEYVEQYASSVGSARGHLADARAEQNQRRSATHQHITHGPWALCTHTWSRVWGPVIIFVVHLHTFGQWSCMGFI